MRFSDDCGHSRAVASRVVLVGDGASTRRDAGQHVRDFLGLPGTEKNPSWKGKLVTDDFSGYKACFELGVTEVGRMAQARRKFHDLWASHGSQVGEQALRFFGELYKIEREVQDKLTGERRAIRAERDTHGQARRLIRCAAVGAPRSRLRADRRAHGCHRGPSAGILGASVEPRRSMTAIS